MQNRTMFSVCLLMITIFSPCFAASRAQTGVSRLVQRAKPLQAGRRVNLSRAFASLSVRNSGDVQPVRQEAISRARGFSSGREEQIARDVAALTYHHALAGKEHDCIRLYQPEDEKCIEEIAQQNINRLVNLFGESNTGTFAQFIRPALQGMGTISKVYVVGGIPVGFINYSIVAPWHKVIAPRSRFGLTAEIHHLAVHKDFQKSGIGSLLVQTAIEDCKAQGAHLITLKTVSRHRDSELYRFYERLGFKITRVSPIIVGDTDWSKKTGPHPDFIPHPFTLAHGLLLVVMSLYFVDKNAEISRNEQERKQALVEFDGGDVEAGVEEEGR